MNRIKRYPSLRVWRAACSFSQREAAQVLGISQAVYAKVELGRTRPRPVRGKVISDKTGVPFEVIMGVA